MASNSSAFAPPVSKEVKAIFFDCDDTLYRNDFKLAKALTQSIEDYLANNLGLPEGKAYELYKAHGTTLRGLIREGIDVDISEFYRVSHMEGIDLEAWISPDPDLRRMLLKIDPSVPKYILTAAPLEWAQKVLNLLGVADLFEAPVIDVAACEYYTKHERECYLKAMAVSRVPHDPGECLFIDDSVNNIRAGKKFGFQTVLIATQGGGASWDGGFAADAGADYVLSDVRKLQTVLPGLFPSTA